MGLNNSVPHDACDSAGRLAQERTSSRIKNSALESLRVKTWFFHLVDQVYGDEVAAYQRDTLIQRVTNRPYDEVDFAKKMQGWQLDQVCKDMTDDELNAVTRLSVRGYDSGKSSPNNMTLTVLDKLLPGSREVYEAGPLGEPLWEILAGNLDVCHAYVDDNVPLGPDLSEGTDTQIQSLMDALIAPEFRLKLTEIPDLGNAQRDQHPVYLTRVNAVYSGGWLLSEQPSHEGSVEPASEDAGTAARTLDIDAEIAKWSEWSDQQRKPVVRDETGLQLEIPTIDDQILAAIALWQICLDSRSPRVLQLEWLLMGLCFGTIADTFSEAVQRYVLNLLRQGGCQVDQMLAKRKAKFLPFEHRWALVSANGC